jgi:hypothetical protein
MGEQAHRIETRSAALLSRKGKDSPRLYAGVMNILVTVRHHVKSSLHFQGTQTYFVNYFVLSIHTFRQPLSDLQSTRIIANRFVLPSIRTVRWPREGPFFLYFPSNPRAPIETASNQMNPQRYGCRESLSLYHLHTNEIELQMSVEPEIHSFVRSHRCRQCG